MGCITPQRVVILIAEDDPDDRELIKEAFAEAGVEEGLRFVNDGAELMEYLQRSGAYTQTIDAPAPDLILLDLNMPRMDGREALRQIKSDPHLRSIPVVALTTSSAEEEVTRSYADGVNSFVTKPVSYRKLVEHVQMIKTYWFEVVSLSAGQAGVNREPPAHPDFID